MKNTESMSCMSCQIFPVIKYTQMSRSTWWDRNFTWISHWFIGKFTCTEVHCVVEHFNTHKHTQPLVVRLAGRREAWVCWDLTSSPYTGCQKSTTYMHTDAHHCFVQTTTSECVCVCAYMSASVLHMWPCFCVCALSIHIYKVCVWMSDCVTMSSKCVCMGAGS